MRRLSLSQRIALFTSLPIFLLVGVTLFVINHSIESKVRESASEDLVREARLFERFLATRASDLATVGRVISHDPKFFAILTVPHDERTADYPATVLGIASEFRKAAGAEILDVTDEHGTLLARANHPNVFGESLTGERRIAGALKGRESAGLHVEDGVPFQVAVLPVRVGDEVVGVLRLGFAIDDPFARKIAPLTQSAVTCITGGRVNATTLPPDADLAGLERWISDPHSRRDEVVETRRGKMHCLSLARQLGSGGPGETMDYVLDRSLEPEMLFLRRVQGRLLAIGFVVGLLGLVLGIGLAQGITRPVRRLVQGASEIERGNYEFPIGVVGDDEIGYLGRSFDRMREYIRRHVASLEELSRMKDKFITIVSHELRTPLTTIRGYAELLQTEGLGPLTPTQREGLEAIEIGVKALGRVADQVTDISLLDRDRLSLAREAVDVGCVLREVSDMHLADAQKRSLVLTTEATPGIPSVFADRRLLVKALSNLVENAIRFTSDGGQVEIRGTAEARRIRIAVRDTGIGIPTEEQGRIWDRLYEGGDPSHHTSAGLAFGTTGVGLGLSIARGIVQAHEGEIFVRSEVGEGSTFTMLLPAAEEGVAPQAKRAA